MEEWIRKYNFGDCFSSDATTTHEKEGDNRVQWGPSGQMQEYAQTRIDSGNTSYLPGSKYGGRLAC